MHGAASLARDWPSGSPPPFRNRSERKPGWHQAAARTRPEHELVVLFGWHSVTAALANPRREIRKLWLTENAARRLAASGIKLPPNGEIVRPHEIATKLPPDAVHQGLLAESCPLPPLSLDAVPTQGMALVLDQITDPHNVGAILRTAAAFAVSAVVLTARHSPPATGTLAKAASGALEWVPLVMVSNLGRALRELKDLGFFVIGLDSAGTASLSTVPLRLPLALVLGAEGTGLRQLTRQTCDLVARLALPGRIKSLNVSNAAALALYVASTRLNPEAG